MKELGIYVHIPFCKQKCYYCDFVSFDQKNNLIDKYVQSLIKEIEIRSNEILNLYGKDVKIATIYIGGGTPSYIDCRYIEDILDKLYKIFNITEKIETTMEVNPGTVDKYKLQMYKNIGINRLSIGLQSTNDKLLKQIGRIHTYKQFEDTYNLARKVGFDNVNVDLIFALPNQSLDDIRETTKRILDLNPEHISTYSLILEEGTKLFYEQEKYEFPEDSVERQMYWYIKNTLEEQGYIHYEISNFAKKGFYSKHNMSYWKQKEYIGYGLAAHSYIDRKRFSNTSNIEEYINNIFNDKYENNICIQEIQSDEDVLKEYIMLGLRTMQGVDLKYTYYKFDIDIINKFKYEIQKLERQGLIEINNNYMKLTKKGLDFANLVWEEFV